MVTASVEYAFQTGEKRHAKLIGCSLTMEFFLIDIKPKIHH